MLEAVGFRPEDRSSKPYIETTVGRVIFNLHLPRPACALSTTRWTRASSRIWWASAITAWGWSATAKLVDDIKAIGFRYATKSGISIAVSDITVPPEKEASSKLVSDEVEPGGAPVPPGPHHRGRAVHAHGRALDQGDRRHHGGGGQRAWTPMALSGSWLSRGRPRAALRPSASWPACAA